MLHQVSPCGLNPGDLGSRQIRAPPTRAGGAHERKILSRTSEKPIFVGLRLFEFAHAVGRTALDGLGNLLLRRGQAEKGHDLAKLAWRVSNQIFVAQQEKSWPPLARVQPSRDILPPGAVRACLARQEARNEFLDRRIVLDSPQLSMIVILRHDHVARVSNYIHNAGITRVEAFVALDDARPGHPVKNAFGGAHGIGDQPVNIRPGSGLIRESQVREKEPGPRVARLGKRNQKNVVGKNEQTAVGYVQAKAALHSGHQMFDDWNTQLFNRPFCL